MARGVSVSSLLDNLRAELSQATGVNMTALTKPILLRALQRGQNQLTVAPNFTWSHMRARRKKTLNAGQRYYDFPTDMPYEQVEKIQVFFNNLWSAPLTRGISMTQYNRYNSDQDVRMDPAVCWDVVDIGGATQFELWPLPLTSVTDGILLTGQRSLKPLVNDADVCDLDSEVLIMYSAGTYLETIDPAQANAKKSQAEKIYNKMIGRAGRSRNTYSFADRPKDAFQRPDKILIPVKTNV